MLNDTSLFDINELKSADISITLREVINALEENSYQPINQLVGYLISGDPGYITSKLDARAKITRLERTEIIEELLKVYITNK